MNLSYRRGFTIVELLIVIVVIGILAAIVIVAFNGVQNKAKVTSISSGLKQYSKSMAAYNAANSRYPTSLEEAGVKNSNGISYQYTSATEQEYCLTATSGTLTYYVSQVDATVQSGVCSNYNLLVWDEASAPVVSGTTSDTSEFRTSPASMRLDANAVGRTLNGGPYTGTVGQTYTVSLWVKSASNWNGTNGNSKIRFGATSGGTLLQACGYGGVKADWTQVSCSYTLTSTTTSVSISVGNDGTVGNIWIDDLSVARSN